MPSQDPFSVDWVYSTYSNAHVAKHEDWFINYTPFNSRVCGALGDETEVVGVGDVQLDVKMKQPLGAEDAYHSLVLRNVLHVPSASANVVAACKVEGFDCCVLGEDGEIYDSSTGTTLLLDGTRLYKLWLRGHEKGQSSLNEDIAYWIRAEWPVRERARWMIYKQEQSGIAGSSLCGHKRTHSRIQSEAGTDRPSDQEPGARRKRRGRRGGKRRKNRDQPVAGDQHVDRDRGQDGNSNAPRLPWKQRYSAEEKTWLKKNYGNEFKFLRAHRLQIYKEGDRQQGERMVRTMMKAEAEEIEASRFAALDSDHEEYDNYGSLPSEEDASIDESADEISDDGSDRPYSRVEMKWLQNGFDGEEQFLQCYGLDFNEPGDRDEGRLRVRAMMRDDGSADDPWMADMSREQRDLVMDAIVYGTRPY